MTKLARAVPRHTHNCDKCIFLGTADDAGWGDLGHTDLYFCPVTSELKERFDSTPDCCRSVSASQTTIIGAELQLAQSYAKSRGLIS